MPTMDAGDPAAIMPFSKLMGVTVSQAGPDRVVGALEVRPDLCTVGEALHGGAAMAFADALGAIGAALSLPDGAAGTTTVESNVSFCARASLGETLRGEATPVHIGRRLSVWQTRIARTDGKLVAIIRQTQLVLPGA